MRRFKIVKIFASVAILLGVLSFLKYSSSYHFSTDVQFTIANTPIVGVKIEEQEYPVLLDFGSKFQMNMKPDLLEKISTETAGTASWLNVKGERYTQRKHTIPKVQIGPFVYKKVCAIEKPLKSTCILWDYSNSN